jgi:hypothetical protein
MDQIQFTSLSVIIRDFIGGHQKWCEEQLGCPLGEAVQLRFEGTLVSLAATAFASDASPDGISEMWGSLIRGKIEKMEFPPDTLPAIKLRGKSSGGKASWLVNWLDCPVAFKFGEIPYPIVVMNIPYVLATRPEGQWREVVLVRKDELNALLALFQDAEQNAWQPGIRFLGGDMETVAACRWEDLILDPLVVRLLRADFESFFYRESWFREKNLPFRRGYLLYGPPGNGKTSAIRAMLSRPGIIGHTMNLFSEHLDDDDLTRLFRQAAETTPSLLILEDIDRCFDGLQKDHRAPRISLQNLLNCLDGATTRDGVVVVATANNPTTLDPAILRRPGRFDRVVAFQNPSKELALRFFCRLSPELPEFDLIPSLEACEGFSFAQLQESYIMAGQNAFEDSRLITAADITEAAHELRKALYSADWKNLQQTGFKPQKLRL